MHRKRLIVGSLVLGLIVAALVGMLPRSAEATPAGYTFTSLASLGDPAPGGGVFTGDFEPSNINNRGDVTFAADLTTGGEGLFLARKGQISSMALPGQSAPGGGVFDSTFLGPIPIPLNDEGDITFNFFLEPFIFPGPPPLGFNAGIYRFSHSTRTLTPVVVPSVTLAPGGGTFMGISIHASINNRGDIAFSGIVTGADIDPSTPPGFDGLGVGIFLADKKGQISSVVSPGDPAPGGGTFDFAENPWINDGGDIAFGAHVVGEECITGGGSQAKRIFCAESVYVMKAATGEIESIAHQGEPAPGGGVYRLAFGPALNNGEDLVFIGDLTPAPNLGQALAVFLHSGGTTIPVARPGDPMPGGGHLLTAAFFVGTYDVNNAGEVSFLGALDTDVNKDGVADTGLFVWSHGSLRLVARTGTVIPGVGTVAHLNNPFTIDATRPSFLFNSADINDRGQVLTSAILADGNVVLLIATPSS